MNTIRYLRWSQIAWRLQRKLFRARVDLRPPPPRRALPGTLAPSLPRPKAFVAPNRASLLNVERALRFPEDWNNREWEKLWLYHLHYFDDLRSASAAPANAADTALVARWIADNAPGRGNGWEPYPLSLRLVNWIRWLIRTDYGDADVVASLATQTRYLTRRLEYHLLGNHLFANLKALVFAATFFEGAEAEEWMAIALPLLDEQVDEQILRDGAHFELSPMYHAVMVEDLLDLLALQQCTRIPDLAQHAEKWRTVVGRMLGWLEGVIHPDGRIPFFNDAAFGASAEPAQLRVYAEQLGVRATSTTPGQSSGYYRFKRGPATVVFDAAPIGPTYLPGHAHADTLSFELSWGDRRVVCNTGCSRYGTDSERLWERSTAAHATVEIDGQNSSEVWSGFRVARRAKPTRLRTDIHRIECAHDGYMRLPGSPVHMRALGLDEDGTTFVTDRIEGSGHHRAVGRFPLHPEIRLSRLTTSAFRLHLPEGLDLEVERPDGGPLEQESGRWCPEFGIARERPVVRWCHEGVLPLQVPIRISVARR